MTTVGIVGAGRAGAGFAIALSRVGYEVRLHGSQPRDFPSAVDYTHGGSPPWLAEVDVILLAVPDDALADAVLGARAMGWRGFNLSIPHKVTVIDHIDSLAASAEPGHTDRGHPRGIRLPA